MKCFFVRNDEEIDLWLFKGCSITCVPMWKGELKPNKLGIACKEYGTCNSHNGGLIMFEWILVTF